MNLKNYFLTLLFLVSFSAFAQTYQVDGVVIDGNNDTLPGVSVLVKGTTNGTTTDFEGKYLLNVSQGDVVVYSFVGFEDKEVTMDGSSTVNTTMSSGLELDEVVILGNRSKPRTILDSPVPIDNIGVEELKSTGQPTVDKMLTYKIPSFNS